MTFYLHYLFFENYNDIQEGDVMECFEVKEVARSLETIEKKIS